MKKLAIVLSALLICCQQKKRLKQYPHPVVAFGFITYYDVEDGQKKFVPCKKVDFDVSDFKTDLLSTGFQFSPSCRVDAEIALIRGSKIENDVKDANMKKHLGVTTYIPVRIIYEIDSSYFGIPPKLPGLDSVVYGIGNNKVAFSIDYPAVDVLKVDELH